MTDSTRIHTIQYYYYERKLCGRGNLLWNMYFIVTDHLRLVRRVYKISRKFEATPISHLARNRR